jgi:membrane protease YdiL (CAAX protease family)
MAFTRRDAAVLLLALVFPTLITWLYFIALADAPAAMQQGAYAVGKLAQFALPVAYVFVWRRKLRPFAESQDAPPPQRLKSFILGGAFGLAVMLAGWLIYDWLLEPRGLFNAAQAEILAKVKGMQLASPASFIGLAVFYSIGHAFLEEYYWRWFVYRECRGAMTQPTAIVISSVGFMAHHVLVVATYFGWASPLTWLLCAAVAIGGAFWAWLYERHGTLLGPWLSHLLIDAMIFFIGYDLIF